MLPTSATEFTAIKIKLLNIIIILFKFINSSELLKINCAYKIKLKELR